MFEKNTVNYQVSWSRGEDASRLSEHEHINVAYAKAVEVQFTAGYKVSDAEYAELKATIRAARLQSRF